MPIRIVDVDKGLGNLVTMSGVVTEGEFTEAMERHLTQDPEKFKRYRFSVTDLSEATELNLSTAAIRAHFLACIRSAAVNPDAVVAVVAPNDLGFGLSRMWEILSEKTSWEIRVFRNSASAKEWIRERVKDNWNIEGLTLGST